MNIAVIVGSATPPGRTHRIAAALVEALNCASYSVTKLVDLALVSFQPADGRVFEAYDKSVQNAIVELNNAAGVIIVSPVYRGTYTGVLKNFLDIMPTDTLRDKPVGLAVLGSSLHHYLGVDLALRALLAWSGALALPTSVYLTGTDFDETKLLKRSAQVELAALANTLLMLTSALQSERFSPEPFAARTHE